MKPLPSLCTLISLILFPLGALGSPFLDQDFQNLSKGPLTTGSGWAIGNSISSNVIADPADASNNVLELKRTSSSGAYVNYSTSSTSPLVLKPETSYEWNFSFRLDSATPRSGSAGSFIWLDTGSNAQTFAGLYIRYNAVSTISAYELYYYSDLGGASNALGSYTLLGTINPGEWYQASFQLTLDDEHNLATTVDVGNFHGSVESMTSTAAFGQSNVVRMAWSLQVDNTVMQFDNLRLQSIPEAGSVALLLFGFAMAGGRLALNGKRPRA